MKVDPTSSSRVRSPQAGTARPQQGGAAAATDNAAAPSTDASSAGDASVSLSSLSSQLRSLAASGSADIDTAHVESIKDAIRNGTLQIDAGKIADGVLDTARSLLKPPSGA